MKETGVQVFGLGQSSLDYIGRVKAYPAADTKCEFTELTIEGGGPAATALVALSRWGISGAFAGVIGDDTFGGMILHSLKREGLNTAGLLVRPGHASQYAFIATESGSGRRTIFWQRPTGPPPGRGEIDLGLLRRAKVFHTDGLFTEASLAAGREARDAGVTVSVDAGSLREGMLELAGLSDCFLTSETFARALVGGDDPQGACRRLAETGPSVVGVTLGARGYVALAGGTFIRRPAYRVDAVDTTGCGDVFHGGFVYGLLRGWGVERCFDFGAWAAARVSLSLGGRSGIPPPGEYPGEGHFQPTGDPDHNVESP